MSKNPYCEMCDSYHFERSSFYDADFGATIYFCSENHRNEYLNKKRNPNYKTSQDKIRDEMIEKRENDKEERHRKLKDIEDYYAKNSEREEKENSERKQRAAELRSQGKNFQAFLVENKNGVIGACVLIGFALFFFFFTQNEESNKADAMLVNTELEMIEDSVKIYINEKNYDRALVLANKLVHSSHEDMEHLEFDAWDGYPKFDEYWTKKREEYKNIIINKGTLTIEESEVKQSPVKSDETEEISNSMEEEAENIQNEIDSMSNVDDLEDEYKY